MRIAFLNWRDSTHREGGGAEHYAETVAAGLAERGHDVTLYCAAHGTARAEEILRGTRVRRQGGRLGVYAASVTALRADERTEGPYDAVVDVQNGIPFFSVLGTRSPVISLVHHVHREQWPVVFGPVASRVGWTVESRVAPRVYRGRQYVAVSERTRHELSDLGVRADDIAVIHNGTDEPMALGLDRSPDPTLIVLGRLVPHKRVEHAIDVLARLRPTTPRLRLRVVGHGWWHDRIADYARQQDVADAVDLLGFVSEEAKHAELARAWVALAPSVKEGWGLCVVEAASHGVPTIAYHGAGGLSESIVHQRTGLLVDSLDDLTRETGRLLSDTRVRETMGAHAVDYARQFTWRAAVDAWERLLTHTAHGRAPVAMTDALPLTKS